VKCLTKLDHANQMNWTDLTLIFRESILSSTIEHPNIVKFYGASLTFDAFYLVYEFCPFGDLQEIIVENLHSDNENIRSIYQRLFYLSDIAHAMAFLHGNGFVHRDLKTANVVVKYSKQRYVAMLCDFGVSRKIDVANREDTVLEDIAEDTESERTEVADAISKQTTDFEGMESNFHEIERTIDVGTPAFLAPEILMKLVKKKGIRLSQTTLLDPLVASDFSTDVYSFGVVVYSLVTAKLPYKGFKPMDMILMVRAEKRLDVSDEEWEQWSAYVSKLSHLKLLLSSCWSQFPQQRPSFAQICQLLQDIAPQQLK